MARFSEFDIYVPLVANSGKKYPQRLIGSYKREILREWASRSIFDWIPAFAGMTEVQGRLARE